MACRCSTRTATRKRRNKPSPRRATWRLLANMILREFPQYAGIFALTEVRIGHRLVTTHNGLLKSYDGADGMKTGFVCAAGYDVVASATRNGRQLVAVVLGSGPEPRARSVPQVFSSTASRSIPGRRCLRPRSQHGQWRRRKARKLPIAQHRLQWPQTCETRRKQREGQASGLRSRAPHAGQGQACER